MSKQDIDALRARYEAEATPDGAAKAELLAQVYDDVAKLVAAEIIGLIDNLLGFDEDDPGAAPIAAIKERFGL